MILVPPSPVCQELLTSCEGLQKQGWQVNTMEGTEAKQIMRSFYDNFLTFKHGTEFDEGFFPHLMYSSIRNSLIVADVLVQAGVRTLPKECHSVSKSNKSHLLTCYFAYSHSNTQKYLYPCLFRTFSCTFVWLTESLFH